MSRIRGTHVSFGEATRERRRKFGVDSEIAWRSGRHARRGIGNGAPKTGRARVGSIPVAVASRIGGARRYADGTETGDLE